MAPNFTVVSSNGIDPRIVQAFDSINRLLDVPAWTARLTVGKSHNVIASVFSSNRIGIYFTNPTAFREAYEPFYSHLPDWEMDDSAGFFDPRIDPMTIFVNDQVREECTETGIETSKWTYFQAPINKSQQVFAWITLAHEVNHLLHYHLKIPSTVAAMPSPLNQPESGAAWEFKNLGGILWFAAREDNMMKVAENLAIEKRFVAPIEVERVFEEIMNVESVPITSHLRLLPSDTIFPGVRKASSVHRCCQAQNLQPPTPERTAPPIRLVMVPRVPDRRSCAGMDGRSEQPSP
ncbi:uncharacterized protein EV422DRAFT_505391 [Fimicolochytrium jonesii]|uniref:uncharacterized protein n=1 Tax=Fimicolochytrium jonesii TaxID=1396493 RepID=UPI0022FE03E2|nr:uncharacterized protein EV422DRAFT_505391 [Fimicolochytrium jonesii]KAI8822588.1 hypothetical protein EV422DRAFT_505391 [Fimicolochytrium jonesii]